MIEKQYLMPEFYIHKIPKCDKCNVVLTDTHISYPTSPVKWKYVCPICNEEYTFTSDELQGEWKWKII